MSNKGRQLGGNYIQKLVVIYALGLLALGVLFILSICQGQADITVETVFDALFHRQNNLEHNMIWDMRMPRTVIGILAGGALAVAGALLQTITANPLAASDTLGINAGAYFMVVLGTVLFPAVLQESPFLFAAVGGIFAALISFLLGGGKKSNPIRLALSGMIVSMVLGSFTSAIRIANPYETQGLFLWGSGSLSQNDWSGVKFALPWIACIMFVTICLAKQWDVLYLDESTAVSLGQKVGSVRLAGILCAVLLATVTVSVVGPIGFVGLVAPHMVKLCGIRFHRTYLPGVFIWGAALLVGADILSRMVSNQMSVLPTGAMMALIGAPWLIYIVLTKLKTSGMSSVSSINISTHKKNYSFSVVSVCITLCVGIFLIGSTAFGGIQIPFSELLENLFAKEGMYASIIQMRMPRTLVAAGAGAALAVSGMLIQIAVRNPLADASTVGVSSGAGLGALFVMILWPTVPIQLLPVAAIAGGSLAAVFIFVLSWKKGLNPALIILMGIAISALMGAGIQILLVQGEKMGNAAFIWITGSTYARTWDYVIIIAFFLMALLPLIWWFAPRFELLQFDDQSATGLGLSAKNTRLLAMVLGVLLASGATACVGTMGYIGLVVPHIVRNFTKNNIRKTIYLAAMIGALMLGMADTIGRTLFAPIEVPSGILTALIGTPYFLWIMYKMNRNKVLK